MVNLKSITRTLPKRPNQIRNWHPQLSAKPDLPKCKREAIVIGTTLDVAEGTPEASKSTCETGVTRLFCFLLFFSKKKTLQRKVEHSNTRQKGEMPSAVDSSWNYADLARVVCDELVSQGLLKEKPAFIR